jgi:hypothetical protein
MIRFLLVFALSFFLLGCGDAKIEVPKVTDDLIKQQNQAQGKADDEERAMQKQMQPKK